MFIQINYFRREKTDLHIYAERDYKNTQGVSKYLPLSFHPQYYVQIGKEFYHQDTIILHIKEKGGLFITSFNGILLSVL